MSFATANGIAIQRMKLALASRRSWTCELGVDTTEPPAIGDRLTIEVPGGRFVGTVILSGVDDAQQVTVTVRAGAGQLTKQLEPRSYTSTTVGEVAQAIATDSGETLSATISASVLEHPLGKWVRPRGDGEAAFSAIAVELGATWRVLPDGKVWIGTDAAEEPAFDYDVRDGGDNAAAGYVDIFTERFDLLPGHRFRCAPVVEILYALTADTCTARVTQVEGGSLAKRKIAKQVAAALEPTKLHPPAGGKVISQNADGTLELRVDSPDMPSISRVPIRHGLPGVTKIELEPGCVVALFFEGGDRKKPFAGLFAGARTKRVIWDGDHFEWGGDKAVAMAALTDARLTAIETYLKTPGPVIGPAPLAPTPIASATLFAKD